MGELLGRLVEDARGAGEAELEYLRLLAAEKIEEARTSLWLGAAATGLMIGASVALVMGLVLTLAPLVGPGFATLIVVGVSGGVAWVLGAIAWRHIKRLLGLTR
ncbi:phage holin family protein [Sphingomonas canadensis]|uniref:Phage holin family protein n=2 Tax=Sphingomonas canadensis TaxID=1219257 RepID=A0ABW3H998_9SPHN